ncbi:hypothetical protein U9M48_017494 [Paspalum notatum var. saurae]|uniref:Receptor-like serine/threonine-protein kinase n=1 Tax=Paspalum notatum var. saurae TaxID=547442 RepID=A0AAQ3T8M5_PASNO
MRAPALFLVLLLLPVSFFPVSISTDTIGLATSIAGNQTLVSAGGVFQLGFFSPDADGARKYLGIWYYNITESERTVVWVANRQSPVLSSSSAVLQLSADGRLVILDAQNATVWASAPPTRNLTAGAAAQLQDNGNFVLSADGSGSEQSVVAWQSFDYPTDTLLPGMKLGVDLSAGITRNITSWRSRTDPSPGDYSFGLALGGGLPQFFLLRGATTKVYTSGPWNGEILTGVPYLKSNDFTFKVVWGPDETYYSYSIGATALLSRLVVDGAAGQLQRFVLINASWSNFWYYPTDPCDYFAKCGPFGYCDNTGQSPVCVCLPGFEPRSPQQWSLRDGSAGCVRRTNLSCGGGGTGDDEFWVVTHMKLPEATKATVHAGMTLDQCRKACLSNCSCRAYAVANVSAGANGGCVIWGVDLLDMRLYTTVVEDVYIRLAKSEVDALNAAGSYSDAKPTPFVFAQKSISSRSLVQDGRDYDFKGPEPCILRRFQNIEQLIVVFPANRRSPSSKRVVIAVVAAVAGVLLLLTVGGCCVWRRRRKCQGDTARNRKQQPTSDEDWKCAKNDVDLPLVDLAVIMAATDSFAANKKIGEGGFGPVYMGKLEDGQEVAVKRLSRKSMQGAVEFTNEVKLIAKLQHRNLVRLLGCCIDEDERLLLYEYMHNQSLDTFIFDEAKRRSLRWQKRFDIILGIARGLQYLHEDSRFRIIHRDLKASNVLLDRNMVPKISDFGIARMFGGDQTTAQTMKVIGTYGYMSPEYAMDGVFSMKSDIYSFGVLVLEIITGKRNRGFYKDDLDLNLLGYAWLLWKEGRTMELVDDIMDGSVNYGEVLRCIQVALLCVEVQPRNRPLMSSAVMMMASENATVPEPNEPGVNIGKNTSDTTESSLGFTSSSVTITAMDAR